MSLTLDEYQRTVVECAINRTVFRSYDYLICGLIGETGELAEEIKRVIRDDGGTITHSRRDRIIEEAGDVLWHVAALGNLHEWELSLSGADSFEDLDSQLRPDMPNWTLTRSVCGLAMHVGCCAHSAVPRYGYLDRMADIMTSLARIELCVGSTSEHVAKVNMAKIRAIQDRAQTGCVRVQYDLSVLHDEVRR